MQIVIRGCPSLQFHHPIMIYDLSHLPRHMLRNNNARKTMGCGLCFFFFSLEHGMWPSLFKQWFHCHFKESNEDIKVNL